MTGDAAKIRIDGIECAPIYLITEDDPSTVSTDDYVADVALLDLIARVRPGQHLYLVDYASRPGRTRLTRLV